MAYVSSLSKQISNNLCYGLSGVCAVYCMDKSSMLSFVSDAIGKEDADKVWKLLNDHYADAYFDETSAVYEQK